MLAPHPVPPPTPEHLAEWRARLDCGFPQVADVFADCMAEAHIALTPDGLHAYLDAARFLGKMGRGPEPVLIFLQEWPTVACSAGEDALPILMQAVHALWKSPNGKAIAPLLQSLAAVARRLPTPEQLRQYLTLGLDLMERTSGSIHGIHKTYASPGLPVFYQQAPQLLGLLSLAGLRQWLDYGIRNHGHHPQRQTEYFALQSADSRAVVQRERHGTLLADHTRSLDLCLRALWQDGDLLVPYSTLDETIAPVQPYYDVHGIRLPDVYDSLHGIDGLDRYRLALAHMAAHRRWSSPVFADNYSPLQRLAIECFEDARMDTLLLRAYPGLRRALLALHPAPREDACDPATQSCLRHRLTLFSRAVLDPEHGYADATLLEFTQRFHVLLEQATAGTQEVAQLALAWAARTRRQSDQLADTYFTDTEVSYRDDNRHLWRFHELSDDEDQFEAPPHATAEEVPTLPPHHYPEWDYQSQTYRPDWVSLYEHLHPAGEAAAIDRLLAQNAPLAKQLQRLLDALKPQDKVRVRFQEDGSELDLDVALRALVDLKSGHTPDPRINMSQRSDGRSIAVTLLLDLSESLNANVPGGEQSVLELSQQAVALLAWAIDQLGDRLAIAGFHSNTRHEVRYLHVKGFGERWDDSVKARLAALQAGWSTRMGAALRHAGRALSAQQADKKLLLVLTDGQPADVDVSDEQMLTEDARQAVHELAREGVFSYCINLDRAADSYVGDIFGRQYTVVDRIERLPEQLPRLFLSLTR